MSETEAIAKMAEIISNDIFYFFRWNSIGGKNLNWNCEKITEHKKEKVKTHPADVVFWYKDPYSNNIIYMHTDLKSYGKATIQGKDFSPALKSLAQQIDCAEISQSWKDKYLKDNSNYIIHGLLFVYNHNSDADVSLISRLAAVKQSNIQLPADKKIFVLDPIDIGWLIDVSNGISQLLSRNEIQKDYVFFYPQKTYQGVDGYEESATIELLKSNIIIIKSSQKSRALKLKVFYRGRGETTEEFQYLLDYFRHNQFLEHEEDNIEIFFSEKVDSNASNLFDKSRHEYIERYTKNQETMTNCLKAINLRPLDHIDKSKSFNENIIGMTAR
ncbi:TPA: hypothetical protein PVK60_001552 [Acinetobacter baumannii]|uniref:hypothetical protein n=1 Tax=Acinetobacter baumannii TaxID=470 RepID=UPI000BF312C6|nr:hypothetical protein [Acinetobacter baumannii]EJB8487583.1 hypothetical protein [Acinetobacter baumannii]MCT9259396.1 hypothetical protein [Acinetobacter baumannii]MCZ3127940.1 hypothetical protein [Acinetobacter baumannii]MDR9625208.1 hypothetical protein [Acinetobacter baumannii]HDI1577784.1 hypothetical protein [Acinetobacter baumannii]